MCLLGVYQFQSMTLLYNILSKGKLLYLHHASPVGYCVHLLSYPSHDEKVEKADLAHPILSELCDVLLQSTLNSLILVLLYGFPIFLVAKQKSV